MLPVEEYKNFLSEINFNIRCFEIYTVNIHIQSIIDKLQHKMF